MKQRSVFRTLIWLLVILFFSDCVSKSTFDELVSERDHLIEQFQNVQSQNQELQAENIETDEKYQLLRDELIKQNSIVTQFISEKLNLEKKIQDLEQQLGSVSSQAESTQRRLNQELQTRNAELQQKETQLNSILESYTSQIHQMVEIDSTLQVRLDSTEKEKIEVDFGTDELKIIFTAEYLFDENLDIEVDAMAAIDKIAGVLGEYPSLAFNLVGHTDNSQVKATRRYQNSLELSLLRSAVLARHLIENTGISSNSINALGEGDSHPRVSNETPAGRTLNNRVEIVVGPSFREIRRILYSSS